MAPDEETSADVRREVDAATGGREQRRMHGGMAGKLDELAGNVTRPLTDDERHAPDPEAEHSDPEEDPDRE